MLIALGVAAFLAVDGYLLWKFAGPGKHRRSAPRGGALFVRACQVLGALLVLAGLAAIVARAGGVISDHWLAALYSSRSA